MSDPDVPDYDDGEDLEGVEPDDSVFEQYAAELEAAAEAGL